MENLNSTMERGGKIELALNKSDNLLTTSKTYKRSAKRVELEQRKRKWMIIGAAVLVVAVSGLKLIIVADSACATVLLLWTHFISVHI